MVVSTLVLPYVLMAIFSISFGLLVTRWALRINARIQHLTAMVQLLGEVAKNQGVSQDKIDYIFQSNEVPKIPRPIKLDINKLVQHEPAEVRKTRQAQS